MRVRISYSVGLDEVPDEVIRLLEKANDNISHVRDIVESMINMIGNDSANGDWTKTEISKLRDLLAKIDYSIADSDSILQGYFDATTPPTEEKEDVD